MDCLNDAGLLVHQSDPFVNNQQILTSRGQFVVLILRTVIPLPKLYYSIINISTF